MQNIQRIPDATDTVCLVGTTAPLISITFTRISTFSVYQWAKYVVDAAIEKSTGRSPLILVNTPNTYPDVATIGCFTVAGAMTGAALTPVVGMLLRMSTPQPAGLCADYVKLHSNSSRMLPRHPF
jgi:hypothetical protein